MTRIGYVRARRKQEIEELKHQIYVDKIYIDLTDEFGFCDYESLKAMLEQAGGSDTIVVRRLNDVADDIGQLCNFLSTLKEKGTELVLLDPMQSGILSDRGCIWQAKNAEFGNHFVHSLARLNFHNFNGGKEHAEGDSSLL